MVFGNSVMFLGLSKISQEENIFLWLVARIYIAKPIEENYKIIWKNKLKYI